MAARFNWTTQNDHVLIKHLGRTEEAVARYASAHGMTKTKNPVSRLNSESNTTTMGAQ